MNRFAAIFLAFLSFNVFCQEVDVSDAPIAEEVILEEKIQPVVEDDDPNKVYNFVEQMPEFPGGINELTAFIGKNLKYPEDARKKKYEGSVYVSLVVNKEGNITHVNVIKGISTTCDAEAVRVIKAMPNWKPGYQNGKKVNTRFVLPINFKIQAEKETKKK